LRFALADAKRKTFLGLRILILGGSRRGHSLCLKVASTRRLSGPTIMIGARLGIWIVDQEIGRGGAGTVYLAHADPVPVGRPRQAAIKVLAPELATDPGFLGRFQREIEVLGRLDHPNIVKLHGSGNQSGRFYFAMEYIEGPSYEALRLEQRRLPWREVLELALQIAPALKHAHDRGIIHRDLKPANLLRRVDGLVILTDFGIASLFASRHYTAAGTVIGTAEYLSPEQAAGRLVTPRSDLYSLGVVLYTLLTGRTPFEGEVVELLQKHRFAQFDRPVRLVPEIPGDFDVLVCQLMAKEPAQRPADAGVLSRQLAGLRRRLEYKSSSETGGGGRRTDVIEPRGAAAPGAATIMSRLMRAELEDQNRGGSLQRVINHPAVLLLSFLASIGILVWTFWPLSAEGLYRHGAALMASSDTDDWERAWDNYLSPLEEKYPENPHKDEVAAFRGRVETVRSARRAGILTRRAGPMTEPQWFYQQGLRLRQQGDEAGARRVWQALAQAFREVPSEAPWVRLAEERLAESQPRDVERTLQPVRDAMRKAKELRAAGKTREAEEMIRGLLELYSGDPAANEIIKKD
jgi:serine/threonine-protein kinase